MRRFTLAGLAFLAMAGACAAAEAPLPLAYDRLAPGFIAETKNSGGFAAGTGFPSGNRWGQYTAYLLATNAREQRTWRIEHYLPNANGLTAQGSTMYLLEGSKRALLIDTANPATKTIGVNDLKTVVRQLLGHTNAGETRADPLDFVVANTHSHGDHIGENALMSDRTVYYMDLDWPANAPPNYVPIREGGGPTAHGGGQAVGEIDLGDRVLKAIAVPPHTKGSTAYLDADNHMVFTGDAMGSSWPWVQWGPLTQFSQSVHHLEQVLAPLGHVDVLPAHFYQVAVYGRSDPPLNGRPLDQDYIHDLGRVADQVLAGTLEGEPSPPAGRTAAWAKVGSARVVYSLATLYPPGETPPSLYHAIAIPGSFRREWYGSAEMAKVVDIRGGLHQIRGPGGEMIYLLKGSRAALLIGAGAGTPGLSAFVGKLIGKLPLEVVALSGSRDQTGGLAQFAARRLHLPPGVAAPKGARVTTLAVGGTIDLGVDAAGRPLRLKVDQIAGGDPAGFTLVDIGDRVLFAGEALGVQGDDQGLAVAAPAAFAAGLKAWMQRNAGSYDVVYTARNAQWFTAPAFVGQVQAAADLLAADGGASPAAGSPGAADIAATVRRR